LKKLNPGNLEMPEVPKKTAVKSYARIRPRFKGWEDEVAVKFNETTISNEGGSDSLRTTTERFFARVFGPDQTNRDMFEKLAKPLCDHVLQGYHSVLIAYGQTGSGKTYTMLGAGAGKDDPGLIQASVEYLRSFSDTKEIVLEAVEVYSVHKANIKYFDLLGNQPKKFSDKIPLKSLTGSIKKTLRSRDEIHRSITSAHAGSHFAATGKNPQSSRGHIAFTATLKVKGREARFVFVDLAGSEGMDALTETDMSGRVAAYETRKLEAGLIKLGLGHLRDMINELKRGKLESRKENGLRALLHKSVTGNSNLSFIFTMAPSSQHGRATENTLRVADDCSTIKKRVSRVDVKGPSAKEIIARLKAELREKEKMISDLEGQLAKAGLMPDTKDRGRPGMSRSGSHSTSFSAESSSLSMGGTSHSGIVGKGANLSMSNTGSNLSVNSGMSTTAKNLLATENKELQQENDELRALLKESEEKRKILEGAVAMHQSSRNLLMLSDNVEIGVEECKQMEEKANAQFSDDERDALSFMRDELKKEDNSLINEIDSVFEMMDKDGNGGVDLIEFTAALKKFGIKWDQETINECFQRIDIDGSQEIELAELRPVVYVNASKLRNQFDLKTIFKMSLTGLMTKHTVAHDVKVIEDFIGFNSTWFGSSYSRKWVECSQIDGMLRVWSSPSKLPRDLLAKINLRRSITIQTDTGVDKRYAHRDFSIDTAGVLGIKKRYAFRAETYEQRSLWERFILACHNKNTDRNHRLARGRESVRVTVNFDMKSENFVRFTFSKTPTVMDVVNLARNSPHITSSDATSLSLVSNGSKLKSTDHLRHGANVYVVDKAGLKLMRQTSSRGTLTEQMAQLFQRRTSSAR